MGVGGEWCESFNVSLQLFLLGDSAMYFGGETVFMTGFSIMYSDYGQTVICLSDDQVRNRETYKEPLDMQAVG